MKPTKSDKVSCNPSLEVMKVFAPILIVVFFITGCAVTKQYYLPVDKNLANEYRVCGSVPAGQMQLPIGSDLFMRVDLTPREDRIYLYLELPLPKGTSVRFLKPIIEFEVSGSGKTYIAHLDKFRVGRDEYFNADEVLEGLGRTAHLAKPDTQYAKNDYFSSGTSVLVKPPDGLLLKFPAILVNGSTLGSQIIQFRLIEKTGVMTCIQ